MNYTYRRGKNDQMPKINLNSMKISLHGTRRKAISHKRIVTLRCVQIVLITGLLSDVNNVP